MTETKTQPSEQPASLEDARTLLEQGLTIDDVVAKSGLNRAKVLGMKGAIVRAAKRLEAAAKQTEAISKPQIQIQAGNKPQLEAPIRNDGHDIEETVETSPRQSSPSNLLDKLAYYQKIPAKDAIIQLIKENSMLEAQVIRNNGHGNPNFFYESGEDELDREMAKLVKAKRLKLLSDDGNGEVEKRLDRIENKLENPKGSDPLATSVQLAKYFSDMSRPKGEGVDPANYIQQGINMVKEVEKNINNPSPKNQFDLQLENMRQNGELDRDKLHWEITKFNQQKEDERQSSKDLMSIVGKVVDGPIADLTKSVGGAAARKIDGMGRSSSVPKVAQIDCPSCKGRFDVIEGAKTVICPNPNCKAILSLQTQPAQQPQEPQPEQPQPSATEQAQAPPQETTTQEKHVDVTS
jgi:hypothetical protein